MPSVAFSHFQEDIQRAKALRQHADTLPASTLKNDIYRSSWMMAVGSLDAYFCDAFADILAKILLSKSIQPNISLSNKIESISLPISTLLHLHNSRTNWKWRNAARNMIEKDNVLSLVKVKDLFNHIMDDGNKILGGNMMETWLLDRDAKQRLMGITKSSYRALSQNDRNKRKKLMAEKIMSRFSSIIQRRHDCIHNCDRPKMSLQRITSNDLLRTIEDVEYLITQLNIHFEVHLRRHLLSIGCTRTTVRRVGA